jgi:hypothetical protein
LKGGAAGYKAPQNRTLNNQNPDKKNEDLKKENEQGGAETMRSKKLRNFE